jgi:hypothetical protein
MERYNASGVTIEGLLAVRHNASYSGRLRCLDSVCDSGKYWWRVRVNGKEAMEMNYMVQRGDNVSLVFE